MGQQQLLLLVLGIVIVGLAVVVGINAFGENQKRANADALVNDGLRIASDIQAYALKPTQFGGAGGWGRLVSDADLDDDFFAEALGYQLTDDEYSNVNGKFTFGSSSASDDAGVVLIGSNDDQSNAVVIRVCGVRSNQILTRINYDGSEQEPNDCNDAEVTPDP